MTDSPVRADKSLEQGEINRLLNAAVSAGQHDVFHGKRSNPRYYLGGAIDICPDPAHPNKFESGILHNISAGGLGWWSEKSFEPRTALLIREHCDTETFPWIHAEVMHSTLGISGHLTGAVFNCRPARPPERQNGATGESIAPLSSDVPLRSGRRRHSSMRSTTMRICGCAGAAGAGVCILATRYLSGRFDPVALEWTAIAVSLVLGGLAGWYVFAPMARFVTGLSDSIRRAQSAHRANRIPPPPSREMANLLDALSELRQQWRTREDDERVQRQKLEELNLVKSNILNTVSHDLRTPLCSIRLYAEMLVEEMATLTHDDQQRFLGIITEECKRLTRLVDGLLEAQRLESGRARWEMKPLDLSKLVRACGQVFDAMAKSKSMTLTVDCPDTLPPVEGDADRISQVLSNLVSNAIKYTQNGGNIHVSAEVISNEVIIAVADNGPGVPREKWDQIFDQFAQVSVNFVREISGVGLGLYIVREIVSRHGGRVWLDSQPGRGSVFFVALPLPVEAAEQPPVQVADGPPVAKVVVCDADPELAARISHCLRRRQFDVRVAHAGSRLLALVVEYQPDVVLTDLLLPDMDSPDVLAALVDQKSRHPFKLLVHTYVGEGADLRRLGADIALARPASLEELLQGVNVALRHDRRRRTILLALPPQAAVSGLRQALSAVGHTPITTPPERAAQVLREFPIDMVLLGEDVLAADARCLRALRRDAPPGVRFVIVVNQHSRNYRRLAGDLGATIVLNRPEMDAEVVRLLGSDAAKECVA